MLIPIQIKQANFVKIFCDLSKLSLISVQHIFHVHQIFMNFESTIKSTKVHFLPSKAQLILVEHWDNAKLKSKIVKLWRSENVMFYKTVILEHSMSVNVLWIRNCSIYRQPKMPDALGRLVGSQWTMLLMRQPHWCDGRHLEKNQQSNSVNLMHATWKTFVPNLIRIQLEMTELSAFWRRPPQQEEKKMSSDMFILA